MGQSKPFLLLEPGPLVPDEPHQRGDTHLLEANTLGNIAQHVLSGRMLPGDYQSRVPCLTDWRRKGTAYDLAPLAQQFPSTNPPDFRPLPRAAFDRSFALQPGGYRLTEAEKGDLLQTNLGGLGAAPSASAPSAGPPRAAASGSTGLAAAPTKIKLKVKDKKRRREGSEQAAGS